MPDRSPDRIYLDSCVFLSWVNAIPDRMPDIDAVLAEGRRGEIELITSTVSMVEVAFGKREQDGRELLADVDDRIAALWRPPSPVKLAEYHELIGEEAKRLMRGVLVDDWRLRPMDAIHLATAARLGAKAFYTYDTKLPKYSAMVGFPIEVPKPLKPQLPWAGTSPTL